MVLKKGAWLNELNRPQTDSIQPPKTKGGHGGARGPGMGVGHHNFDLLF